jgi:hypothetical protein
VINFADLPLRRVEGLTGWESAKLQERSGWLRSGLVPSDYPDAVAADWPALLDIVTQKVKPTRDGLKRDAYRERWWRFGEPQTAIYRNIERLKLTHVLAVAQVSPQHTIAKVRADSVFAITCVIFLDDSVATLAILQSKAHELWVRMFASSLKDDRRYTPSDCFRTFPFPNDFETNALLEAVGDTYNAFRAGLMVERNEGLTKTYNRFHARGENSPDIARLRSLHHQMDVAVLRAYGWDDLAERAAPEFIEQDTDEGKTPKTRLDWPAEFKDEVLARLLALNAERAATEKAAGLTPIPEDEEDEADLEEAAVA